MNELLPEFFVYSLNFIPNRAPVTVCHQLIGRANKQILVEIVGHFTHLGNFTLDRSQVATKYIRN